MLDPPLRSSLFWKGCVLPICSHSSDQIINLLDNGPPDSEGQVVNILRLQVFALEFGSWQCLTESHGYLLY